MKLHAFLILISLNLIFAQNTNSLFNSMIATEFSFANYAAEHGTREAFLRFIADDGILFRPNAVNGKKFLSESKPSKGLLNWYPVIAEISKAGDLGFTTGPWEYRKDKDSAAIAFGNFCTVWELQKDGTWKFAIDIGSNNDKPVEELIPIHYDKYPESKPKLVNFATGNVDELIELDRSFSDKANGNNPKQSYEQFISSTSRFLRNGLFPIIGTNNISKYLQVDNGNYEFVPIAGKISSSKDLGFTYGTLTVNYKEEIKSQKFNYLHIWQKDKSGWKIAVDMIDEVK